MHKTRISRSIWACSHCGKPLDVYLVEKGGKIGLQTRCKCGKHVGKYITKREYLNGD